MFIAYAIPKHDTHMLVEDGIGFIDIGHTEAQAKERLNARLAQYDPEGEYEIHLDFRAE